MSVPSATRSTDGIRPHYSEVGDAHGGEEPKSEEPDWPHPVYTIVVDAPDTAGNFTLFNIPCDVLDSDFLMQPVNEADYDSETQACVDRRQGTHTSFYDHYVTKRKKKKGLRNCGIESPAPPPRQREEGGGGDSAVFRVAPSAVRGATTPAQAESAEQQKEQEVAHGCSSSADTSSALKDEKAVGPSARHLGMPSAERGSSRSSSSTLTPPVAAVERSPPDSGFLMAPSLLGGTSGVGKGALSNAAIRRVACGRMPPPSPPSPQAPQHVAPSEPEVETAHD